MTNDPKVERSINPAAVTPAQEPLVEGAQLDATTFKFEMPRSQGASQLDDLRTKLTEAPRDPFEKAATLQTLDDLGKFALEYTGDRSSFADTTAQLRELCKATNDVDVKRSVFVALERIGLVEPETMRMLREETRSDYSMVGAAARHAFYAIASQRGDVAAA